MFKKSKYPIFNVSFWLIIFFSILSIINILFQNYSKFEIKQYFSTTKPITINVSAKEQIKSTFFICYDNYCDGLNKSILSNTYTSTFNSDTNKENYKKIKNIYLAYPIENKNFKKNIDSIDLHIGNDKKYITNLDNLKFKKFSIEVKQDKNTTMQEFGAYLLSNEGNCRKILNNISTLFLSLFYNWNYFIIPYFWLFVLSLIYIFKKDEIKIPNIKINSSYLLILIFITGVILRLSNLEYYPFSINEINTKTAISSWLSCFQNVENLPLFFIIEKIFSSIFDNSILCLRILSFIFGILFAPIIYLLFKNINKKLALFASFLAAINFINIFNSAQAQEYSLSGLICIIGIYLLFNYLKNPNLKNLIYYSLISILALNLNYLFLVVYFINYIFSFIKLSKNKKELINFTFANIIAFLSFIPYLIISSKNISSFSISISYIKENFNFIVEKYFLNIEIFAVFGIIILANLIICFIKNSQLEKINLKINKIQKDLYIYLNCILILFFTLSSIISFNFKPILNQETLYSIYPIIFLIEILTIFGLIQFIKENKIIKTFEIFYFVILLALFFQISKPTPEIITNRFDDFIHVLSNEAKKYENSYEIHAICPDFKNYSDTYPEIKTRKITWHFIDKNQHINNINKQDFINTNKKSIIYVYSAVGNPQTIRISNLKSDLFETNTLPIIKIKHKPKGE